MLVNKTVQLTILTAAALLWEARTDAAPSTFRVCGRKLSEFMSRVCQVYNSPSWDAPSVVEQPASTLRRRRETSGISDCCTYGCTWEQLSEYCSEVNINSDTLFLDDNIPHDTKRSAEQDGNVKSAKVDVTVPVTVGDDKSTKRKGDDANGTWAPVNRREVGSTRSGGYGRTRRGRRRCGCRRRRRSGLRRASLMGNTALVENVTRGPPSIGTVSPLLTWGRTLNTDFPEVDGDRYAYVAVYSTYS